MQTHYIFLVLHIYFYEKQRQNGGEITFWRILSYIVMLKTASLGGPQSAGTVLQGFGPGL